jgi:hypothetical protein
VKNWRWLLNNHSLKMTEQTKFWTMLCRDTLNFCKPESSRQWYNNRFLLWYLFSL